MRRVLLLLALALVPVAGIGGCTVVASAPMPEVTWTYSTAAPQVVQIAEAPDVYYCEAHPELLSYRGQYYWYREGAWYHSGRWNGRFTPCRQVPAAFLRIPEHHVVYQRAVVHHPDYHPGRPPPGQVRPPPGHVAPPPGHVRPPPPPPPGHKGKDKDKDKGKGGGKGR